MKTTDCEISIPLKVQPASTAIFKKKTAANPIPTSLPLSGKYLFITLSFFKMIYPVPTF
jgi:hypothetical protein